MQGGEENNLPDSFSAVLQRAMDGGAAGGDTPEAGDTRLYCFNPDWVPYVGWDHLPVPACPPPPDQPLSDVISDIALAGAAAAFHVVYPHTALPHAPPHPSLFPDVLQVSAEGPPRSRGAPSVPHSYWHGPSHIFL